MTFTPKPFQSPPPRPEDVDVLLPVLLQRIADNQPDTTTPDLPSEEAS